MFLRKLLLVTGVVLASFCAQAQVVDSSDDVDSSASGAEMALDLAIARPLGLAATVLGTAVFILQLPLDLVGWQSPAPPARKLVLAPARFTFTRPLGDFD